MIESKLASLGLDEKERRFYLATLQLGLASVTEIAARAGVTRTNGYDLLARLEARGLVKQTTGNGARHVVAEDPIVLISNWERTRNTLDSLVPELRSLFNAAATRPRIRFYEGTEGIERALWETLECRSGTLLGVLSMPELLEVPGVEGMQKYITERVKRGIRLRVLRSRGRETARIWPSSQAELRELRYAPPSIDLGMTMYLNDDTVTYLSSKRENYGLIVESAEFSALSRALFEGLWTISTSKP
ncbi:MULTISPECIES: TrmB family transcriptional regulator [Bradyrhizobium]|jgi:HTH-type transcriptional regulator, sugar sensing transcriptional regulator|uniref:TrmB family transcriptional regulator n=1 Tax=Bradyrhizobium TaxID=374 RepID=UPI00293ED2DC|nr:helix-turn-helix domain-containing protein [Bradyrhizobium sp. NDS-1]WOH76333.1 helix-turn-helix domain-containing protein [Bradyrhizobium sp. NDS-1]